MEHLTFYQGLILGITIGFFVGVILITITMGKYWR